MKQNLFVFRRSIPGKWSWDYAYGLVNTEGKVILPCKYDKIEVDEKEMTATAWKKNKYVLIDLLSEEGVIPGKFDSTWSFYNGMAKVKQDGCVGYINRHGDIVVPCVYQDAYYKTFGDNFIVKKNNHWGIVKADGEIVKGFKYDSAEEMIQIITPADSAHDTDSTSDTTQTEADNTPHLGIDLQQITENGLIGFANAAGEVVIPCKYTKVAKYDRDEAGKTCAEYPDGLWTYGYIQVKNESGLWGMIDSKGCEIVPCEYDGIVCNVCTIFAEPANIHFDGVGFVLGVKNNKYTAYDKNGNQLGGTKKKAATAKKKAPEMYEGRPVLLASNSKKVQDAVAKFKEDYPDIPLEAPYVVRAKGKLRTGAFKDCKTVDVVILHDNVEVISNGFGWKFRSLKHIEIPNSVTEIDDRAFYCCYDLVSIVIPDSVTRIGVDAFCGCGGLKEISIKSKDLLVDAAVPEGVNIIERG